jgi:hypothetical protein
MTLEIADVSRLEPRLVGYFPKRTAGKLDWLADAGVEEVCSVSTCISKGPDGWVDRWLHNPLGFFPSEEIAWGVVGVDREAYDMYAYRMIEAAFQPGGGARSFDQHECRSFEASVLAEPLPADYELLGWDVAGNWLGWQQSMSFECSPLTCNGMAREIETNRHGLIWTLAEAIPAALQIGIEQPEPGTYYLLEVWRKRCGGRSDGPLTPGGPEG